MTETGGRGMNTYGKLLRALIDFSDIKLSAVADEVDYDVSYISKWCNKDKLPAGRMAPGINRTLAGLFSREILNHGDLENFRKAFSVEADEKDLPDVLCRMLTESYQEAGRQADQAANRAEHQTRILVQATEVYDFFNRELPEVVRGAPGPVEVLCTLDVCRFLGTAAGGVEDRPAPNGEIRVKMGLNAARLYAGGGKALKDLYCFLRDHRSVSFDFYDDARMDSLNTVVVRGHLAVLCALDQYSRVLTAAVVTDPQEVDRIYLRTQSAFRTADLMLHATEPDEFYRCGYRTDFYVQDHFQIFLTHGFEYLLPEECWEPITRTARERDGDEFMARLVARLQITWEEIFEKGAIDFFLPKSSLMRYMEEGEIIFADVVYTMSPQERKLHIRKVMDVTAKNPNIRFYVIDDDNTPASQQTMGLSVFNNHKKLFLKNVDRYQTGAGPHFYSVLSDRLIREVGTFFDELKSQPGVMAYDGEGIHRFVERYGSMVERMIDLSGER